MSVQRPLIVLFVGVPGSGKTTFARQLAAELHAVHLTGDGARSAMWGDRQAVDAAFATKPQRKINNPLTFNALDYATTQIVAAGHSVLYDCNANRYDDRVSKYDIAKARNAVAVTVRIKVPYDVALQRVQQRDESPDVMQFSSERAKEVLDSFTKSIQEPDERENAIYIDGQADFTTQFAEFQAAVAKLQKR